MCSDGTTAGIYYLQHIGGKTSGMWGVSVLITMVFSLSGALSCGRTAVWLLIIVSDFHVFAAAAL